LAASFFRQDADLTTDKIVNFRCFILTKIIPVALALFLIFGIKALHGKFGNTLAVPKLADEINPFFAAVGLRRTTEKTVHLWENGIQQRNKIVFEDSLYFGVLLILPEAAP